MLYFCAILFYFARKDNIEYPGSPKMKTRIGYIVIECNAFHNGILIRSQQSLELFV